MHKVYELTSQEQEKRKKIIDLCIYYDIPYAIYDEPSGCAKDEQMYKDWSIAKDLFANGRPLPKDLEARLLKYKEQNKNKNKETKSFSCNLYDILPELRAMPEIQ